MDESHKTDFIIMKIDSRYEKLVMAALIAQSRNWPSEKYLAVLTDLSLDASSSKRQQAMKELKREYNPQRCDDNSLLSGALIGILMQWIAKNSDMKPEQIKDCLAHFCGHMIEVGKQFTESLELPEGPTMRKT